MALRRVRAQPVEWRRERLARHPGLVRRALADRARTAERTSPIGAERPPRPVWRRGLAVRHARRRRAVGIVGMVRPTERAGRRPRHRRPAGAGDPRGRAVHRRPLEAGDRSRDGTDARRVRRRRTADLPQRHTRHGDRDAHRPGRRARPITAPQHGLETRPRPSTVVPRAGTAGRVHVARRATTRWSAAAPPSSTTSSSRCAACCTATASASPGGPCSRRGSG